MKYKLGIELENIKYLDTKFKSLEGAKVVSLYTTMVVTYKGYMFIIQCILDNKYSFTMQDIEGEVQELKIMQPNEVYNEVIKYANL